MFSFRGIETTGTKSLSKLNFLLNCGIATSHVAKFAKIDEQKDEQKDKSTSICHY